MASLLEKNWLSLPSELLQVVADLLGSNIEYLVNLLPIKKKEKQKKKKMEKEKEEEEEEEEKMFAEWTALPTELLQLVANHLKPDMTDYIRFCSVCTSWRSFTTDPRVLDYPAQSPWLILKFDHSTNNLHFILASDGRKHSITLPELHKKYASISYEGWLVIEDHHSFEIFMFNPITRKTLIHFPPLSNLQDVEDIFNKKKRNLSYVSAVAPDTAPNSVHYTYVVCLRVVGQLAAFRAGDTSWTVMDTDNKICRYVIYFEKKFFASTFSNKVLVFDSTNLQRVVVVQCPVPVMEHQLLQLVEFSGKMMVVHTKYKEYEPAVVVTQVTGLPMRSFVSERVEMLELDFKGPGRYARRKRTSIGDQMLFIGCSPAFLFPADRFAVRGEKDSVYISENLLGNSVYDENYRPGVYSFKNGKIKKLPWNIMKLFKSYNVMSSKWHKPCFH